MPLILLVNTMRLAALCKPKMTDHLNVGIAGFIILQRELDATAPYLWRNLNLNQIILQTKGAPPSVCGFLDLSLSIRFGWFLRMS